MFKVMRVTGNSLSPVIMEGDYVVVTTIPFFLTTLTPGDIVVFHQPPYGVMIKRVASINVDADEITVLGTHEQSTDSRQFGPVPKKSVRGKVIYHIRKH